MVTPNRKSKVPPQKRRGPGRPATGKGELIGVRIQPAPLSALDAFVSDQRVPVSRPEAIRVILTKFLRSRGYLTKTSRQ
jgi:hypothetical protein